MFQFSKDILEDSHECFILPVVLCQRIYYSKEVFSCLLCCLKCRRFLKQCGFDFVPKELARPDPRVYDCQSAQEVRVKLISLPQHHVFALQPKVPFFFVFGMARAEVKHAFQMATAVEEE